MEENGFTGLNPARAKGNIDEFYSLGCDCVYELDHAGMFLFEQLRELWASPNAILFDREFSEKIRALNIGIFSNVTNICLNAVRAYNIVATAHGCENISGDYYALNDQDCYKGATITTVSLLEEKPGGGVGMNTKMVKDFLLPSYKTKMENVISQFENLPQSIALYDDENGQQRAFEFSIKEFITKVKELKDELVSAIEKALETEVDNIYLAKEQATQALNG